MIREAVLLTDTCFFCLGQITNARDSNLVCKLYSSKVEYSVITDSCTSQYYNAEIVRRMMSWKPVCVWFITR